MSLPNDSLVSLLDTSEYKNVKKNLIPALFLSFVYLLNKAGNSILQNPPLLTFFVL